MFLSLRSKKGQAFSEYAIFIGIIIAAFMAMQHYIRNAASAKLKAGADYMMAGDKDNAADDFLATTELYDPYATKSVESESTVTGGKKSYTDGAVGDEIKKEESVQKGYQEFKTE